MRPTSSSAKRPAEQVVKDIRRQTRRHFSAEEIIVLADASKFEAPSGNVVCGLDEIDIVVTDASLNDDARKMLESAKIRVIFA
jgi:DeoR/GlpR family transcriptional regulator of sugar metabolism